MLYNLWMCTSEGAFATFAPRESSYISACCRIARRLELSDLGWFRTNDLQIRNLLLYPAELRGLRHAFLDACCASNNDAGWPRRRKSSKTGIFFMAIFTILVARSVLA